MIKNLIQEVKPYSHLCSWAIWESTNADKTFTKEKDLKEDIDFSIYQNELQQSNSIIIAMNPGGDFDEELARKVSRKCPNISEIKRPFNNFHNVGKSCDYRLAQALNDSKLRGSYMTDFFPIRGSNSNQITRFIENNPDVAERLVRELKDEIELILPKQDTINIICVGSTANTWADKYLKDPKFKKFIIHHYSGAGNGHLAKYAKINGIENNYKAIVKHRLSSQGLDISF